jgi:hypothetical protein
MVVVGEKGHVRLSYNPYSSTYFFSRNSIFLSPQINQNSVPAGFSDQPNTAKDERDNEGFKLKPKT